MSTRAADKKMGLALATIVGMNAMIGASIFTIPEQLHKIVGPAALVTYIFVIAAVWCIAYSLARMAHYYPREGSFYTYAQVWAGKRGGLIAASLYCAGLIVALGLLTKLTGTYLHTQIPNVSATTASTLVLFLLSASIIAGTKLSQAGQIVLIALTLLPMLIITVLSLAKADMSRLTPFAPYGFNAIFQASKIVVFGFFGFEAVASLYNSIQKPEKNISKAITYSILLVSALYFVFVFSTLVGLPRELFLSGRTLPEALYAMFPEKPWLITLTVWGIIITLMGTLHAMIWSISSLIRSLSTLNYKASVVVVTLLVWLSSVIFKSLDLLFNITALCIIVALVAAIMPLLTKHVPARISERIIAFFALISSTIMCAYAVEGIWRQLANGL